MGTIRRLIQGKYNNDGDLADIRIDPSTHALKTIEYEHAEAHGGDLYHFHYLDAEKN